jgi:hypothetical protein
MKHLERTLEAYMYSHCSMSNIPVYFCNIKIKHSQHLDKTLKTLETYSCNMGFACMNGGTPARRSTTAHGPRCATATWATRRWARLHMNLVSLACLLDHPSWRLTGLVEAATVRRQRGGGRRGRLGPVGNATRRLRRGGHSVTPQVLWLLINLPYHHTTSQSIHD